MENNHKSILKSTSLFGLLQIVKMVISIITTKAVALLIGPIGLGFISLISNTITLISSISSFEFLKTTTREFASIKEEKSKINNYLIQYQKIAFVSGVFGAIISIVFSKKIAQLTFGNTDKQYWFYFLALYFLIISFSNVRMALLQGLNDVKKLIYCQISIAIASLVGSLLLYYFLKMDGIIWVFIYLSISTFFISYYFTREFPLKFDFKFDKNFAQFSKPIMKFGFVLSINLIIGQIGFFVIRMFLNQNGKTPEILGFYEAGNVILANYLGLIFANMVLDFYPKLSSFIDDKQKANSFVNHQIEIATLLVTPISILLLLVAKLVIPILYSTSFLPVYEMLIFGIFSVIMKAFSMPIAFFVLAKGDKKQYFLQELLGDFLNVSLTILLYSKFNLLGIGLALAINYFIYAIFVYFSIKKKHQFELQKHTFQIFFWNIILSLTSIFSLFFFPKYGIIIASCIFLFVLYFSWKNLNKHLSIVDYLTQKWNKLRN